MDLYTYSEFTKEYTGIIEAYEDIPESKKQGHFVPLIPANATTIEPPSYAINEIPIFENGVWAKVKDYRQNFLKVDNDLNVHDITTLGSQIGFYVVTKETGEDIKKDKTWYKIENNQIVKLTNNEHGMLVDPDWYKIVDGQIVKKTKKEYDADMLVKAKIAKNDENSQKCNEKLTSGKFIVTVDNASASYYYNKDTQKDLNSAALGFLAGIITEKQWTDEDGNTVMLSQENVAEMLLTLESWGNPIWDKWGGYKQEIEACTKISQLDNIIIDYSEVTE